MKKIFIIAALIACVSIEASSKNSKVRGLFDVVAPVLNADPHPANREVGQIFYDNVAGLFKGVNRFGDIDILTNQGGGAATALPKASVEGPGGFQYLTYDPNTGYAPVIFLGEVYDVGSIYDGNTGTFTAPVDGFYSISANLTFTGGPNSYSDGDTATIATLKNGTDLGYSNTYNVRHTPTGAVTVHISADYQLNAGDTMQVVVGATKATAPVLPVYMIFGWGTFKQIP